MATPTVSPVTVFLCCRKSVSTRFRSVSSIAGTFAQGTSENASPIETGAMELGRVAQPDSAIADSATNTHGEIFIAVSLFN